LRILHLITTIDRGGAELQLLGLIRLQVAQGHNVTVMPLKGICELRPEILSVGANVEESATNLPWFLQTIAVTLVARKFDVIHCHLPQAELVSLFCPRRKTLSTRHFGGHFYPSGPKLLSKMLARLSELRKSWIVSISQSQYSFLADQEILSSRKLHLISYGFDPTRFVESSTRNDNDLHFLEQMKAGDYKILGVISRLSQEKQVGKILKCFNEAFLSNPNKWILVILGEGELEESLRSYAYSFANSNQVFFIGKKQNVGEFYQLFDVLVHASKFEGFGMVYLEAIYFNTPIVTTPNTAAIEIFGLTDIVSFSDFDSGTDFQQKVTTAMKSVRHRREAYADILQKYSMRQAYSAYMVLYSRMTKDST